MRSGYSGVTELTSPAALAAAVDEWVFLGDSRSRAKIINHIGQVEHDLRRLLREMLVVPNQSTGPASESDAAQLESKRETITLMVDALAQVVAIAHDTRGSVELLQMVRSLMCSGLF